MANARIGALRVDLGMNTAAFEKGVGIAERKLNRFAGNMQKVGKRMQGIGKNLTIGLTAPLAAFGYKATQAAIDAEEMESAFNVVFGNMSNDVRKWAEETGNAMGRSTQEIQRGALAFQELFGKALAPEKAAEMSKQFAVLTQDLASFKNLSNDVAQQKLFSGLTGEAEPLRSVGVFINAAATDAKALELGLEKVNGKYTDQQKIVARAAVIQEQLSNAQGDVLRTSDSAANKIKAAKAAFEELSITVGTKLVPVLTPLVDKLAAALNWFSTLPDSVQTTVVAVGAFAAVLGPVVLGLGALVSGVGSVISVMAPLIAVVKTAAASGGILVAMKAAVVGLGAAFTSILLPAIGAIKVAMTALLANPIILGAAAVIGGIYLAWKNWDKIKGVLSGVGSSVSSWWSGTVMPTFRKFIDFNKTILKGFVDLHIGVVNSVRKMAIGVKTWMQDKLASVFNWVGDKTRAVSGFFNDMYIAVVGNSYVPDMVDGIADHMARLDKVMVEKAKKTTAATKQAFRDLAADIRAIMDEAYPDAAKLRAFRDKSARISEGVSGGLIGEDDATKLRERLFRNLSRDLGNSREPLVKVEKFDLDEVGERADAFIEKSQEMARKSKIATVAVAKSFADMARDAVSSLGNLVDSIKGGGFFDILGSLVQFGLQLGSAGVFGKGIASSLNSFGGARAMGGPVSLGKSYLVGENGPEIFSPGSSGSITPNHAMGGGIAQIVPSPYFDVVVDGRIQTAAPTIANEGAQLAVSRSARAQSRRTR